MTEYTSAGFTFKQVAKKGDWYLFKGTRDGTYHTYELVRIVNGKFPSSKLWGKDGFSFLSFEDALRAMKIQLNKGVD